VRPYCTIVGVVSTHWCESVVLLSVAARVLSQLLALLGVDVGVVVVADGDGVVLVGLLPDEGVVDVEPPPDVAAFGFAAFDFGTLDVPELDVLPVEGVVAAAEFEDVRPRPPSSPPNRPPRRPVDVVVVGVGVGEVVVLVGVDDVGALELDEDPVLPPAAVEVGADVGSRPPRAPPLELELEPVPGLVPLPEDFTPPAAEAEASADWALGQR
jgi:hypothetical protein